ncbi:scavenger receptor class B member 1-like isoform X1 [Leptopilina heterotoma]|uniref:scavenger receptor class B member 1-like isoform X1 n=1 Tax=Leptopilina heterotoma TaxID=63436 RepID=UPI001CA99E96|nr:scavenger receptor class B member 1-like isoform X1 [Leptopilina heterotoma]
MKDIIAIWNRLTTRRYTAVSTNPAGDDGIEEITMRAKGLRRKSSVVVNQFFNAALPVNIDGKPRWNKSILILMTLGLLGLASGCFLLIVNPYEAIFKYKVTFGEGGEIFELWRSPPVDLYLKVYLFNFTNHREFMSGEDKKMKLQEVGPYVYKELLEHGNVTFNDNGTLSAIPLSPLVFVPELSGGTEDDLLILPNIALLSIANVVREEYFKRLGLNLLIRQTNSEPLVEMTAKEFMFGYKSTLVTLGYHVMPNWIKFDKLGLIDRMYDFTGDFETVYTGETDVRKTGLIDTYNGDVNLPQWQGKCANVNGASDGTKFPSYIEPNDTLLFFRKSLCRSANMVRVGEKTIGGLHTYQYKFKDNELDNGIHNPDNACFCRKGRCLPEGLIDVTDCYYGFPIALSYPHFYMANPVFSEKVEGLTPDPEKHESYFFIQPRSGSPVDLAFRFQINMALQDISRIARVEQFADIILPLLWFEIGMYELPEAVNNKFKLYLNYLPFVQDIGVYLSFIGGSFVLIWSIVRILLHQPKRPTGMAWSETEMQKQRLHFPSEKDPSAKSKEMEVYYNSLLSAQTEEMTSIAIEDLPIIKEDIA